MKSVVLLSGGLDSTVLATLYKRQGDTIHGLSFDYGQRHKRELSAASRVALRLDIGHSVIGIGGLSLPGSSLTDERVDVPQGHYEDESMRATVVPNRNAVMLSIAWAWGLAHDFDRVAFAAHAGDHAIYPDCREEFTIPLLDAFLAGNEKVMDLATPFLDLTKTQIVKLAYIPGELPAPLSLSYSCYEGRFHHCGKCGTCVERIEAFRDAGYEDPTRYED